MRHNRVNREGKKRKQGILWALTMEKRFRRKVEASKAEGIKRGGRKRIK